MIWVLWFVLAVEVLAISVSLWIMWAMISEASRAPADPFSAPEHSPEAKDEPASFRKDEDLAASFCLEDVDERGYVSRRGLGMGCEAAVCRTPFGARIVAGRRSLGEPQYAWDYASVGLAQKALLRAEFDARSRQGIVVPDGLAPSRAAEPRNYFRRWRYTADGRMERF